MSRFICNKCGASMQTYQPTCPKCFSYDISEVSDSSASESVAKAMANSKNYGDKPAFTANNSMYDGIESESSPKTIDDCVKPDKLSSTLWKWAKNIETIGVVVLVLIIIGGAFIAYNAGSEATLDSKTMKYSADFNFKAFFSSLSTYAIIAVVEYCIYHVFSLLIASLASIVQNTRITARIAEYSARNNSQQDIKTSNSPVNQ